MNNKVQKVLPVILSIAGSIGVVGTSIMAVKNSKNFNVEEGDDNKVKAKKFIKAYWPSILIGTATVGSITAGTIISKKVEASLAGAVIMLERGYNKYQGKVKEVLGIDTHNKILGEIAKDDAKKLNLKPETSDHRKLYYNKYIGHFYANQEDIYRALLNMNMRLNSTYASDMLKDEEKGVCTIYQFIEDSKAELLDEKIADVHKDFGWTSEYLNDVCEEGWIYDGYSNSVVDGKEVTVIEFVAPEAIYIPTGWNHDKYLEDRSKKWHGTYIEDQQCDELCDSTYEDLNDIANGKDTDERAQ